MTHAPTPWKQHQTNGQTYASVRSANNDTVADCGTRSDPRAQANAELIVRAVNAHAALVKALRDIINAADRINDYQHSGQSPTMEMWSELFDESLRARTVCAKAEGGQL